MICNIRNCKGKMHDEFLNGKKKNLLEIIDNNVRKYFFLNCFLNNKNKDSFCLDENCRIITKTICRVCKKNKTPKVKKYNKYYGHFQKI